MIVVDLIFAALYNLVTDYKQEMTLPKLIGKVVSVSAVVMVFGHYILILEQSIFRPHMLGEVEH